MRSGIQPQAVEALLDFGRVFYLHKEGCEVVYFDNAARAARQGQPAVARVAEKLAYLRDSRIGRNGN